MAKIPVDLLRKTDKMGEVHNAITEIINKSKLPYPEVLMILKMLMSDVENRFRLLVQSCQVNEKKK